MVDNIYKDYPREHLRSKQGNIYKIFINQIEEYGAGLGNRMELIFDACKEKISVNNESFESLKYIIF